MSGSLQRGPGVGSAPLGLWTFVADTAQELPSSPDGADHGGALAASMVGVTRRGNNVASVDFEVLRQGSVHAMTPEFTGISHLDLSVSDVDASATWYERVLGLAKVRRVEFPSRTMVVLLAREAGLVIGLNAHAERPDGQFDERRVGLDHVGFAVRRREDLDTWQTHLAELGVEHSPVADGDSGSALVFRDPDNIQLEIWWSRPRKQAASRPASTS